MTQGSRIPTSVPLTLSSRLSNAVARLVPLSGRVRANRLHLLAAARWNRCPTLESNVATRHGRLDVCQQSIVLSAPTLLSYHLSSYSPVPLRLLPRVSPAHSPTPSSSNLILWINQSTTFCHFNLRHQEYILPSPSLTFLCFLSFSSKQMNP